MGISIILPAYNEEKNLRILLPALKNIIEELTDSYEFIIVDALNSTDNTKDLCEQYHAIYIKQKTIGYGNAFREGIKNSSLRYILVVDTDNSQDISKIPQMFTEIRNGADIVIGSRYAEGGSTQDPFISVAMSKLLNLCYRVIFRLPPKDVSTDFRFYDANKLKSIDTKCENFDVIEEALFLLIKKYPNIVIKEVPINYKKRLEGKSKRQLLKFISDYIKLIFRLLKIKKGV